MNRSNVYVYMCGRVICVYKYMCSGGRVMGEAEEGGSYLFDGCLLP